MNTPKLLAFVFCCTTFFLLAKPVSAQEASPVIVLHEASLPAADSAAFRKEQPEHGLPGARFASLEQLESLLADSTARLLVLPYGSAFPEESWSAIQAFLQRGGNLLVLGGRPFTRAAYRDSSGWHLREYGVRFIRQLSIDQFQTTPGSAGLEFQNNPDVLLSLPRFSWQRAFSRIIRLSAVDLYNPGRVVGHHL